MLVQKYTMYLNYTLSDINNPILYINTMKIMFKSSDKLS